MEKWQKQQHHNAQLLKNCKRLNFNNSLQSAWATAVLFTVAYPTVTAITALIESRLTSPATWQTPAIATPLLILAEAIVYKILRTHKKNAAQALSAAIMAAQTQGYTVAACYHCKALNTPFYSHESLAIAYQSPRILTAFEHATAINTETCIIVPAITQPIPPHFLTDLLNGYNLPQ